VELVDADQWVPEATQGIFVLAEELQLFLKLGHCHVSHIMCFGTFTSSFKLNNIGNELVDCLMLGGVAMAFSIR
jgi:hypothetical protein